MITSVHPEAALGDRPVGLEPGHGAGEAGIAEVLVVACGVSPVRSPSEREATMPESAAQPALLRSRPVSQS